MVDARDRLRDLGVDPVCDPMLAVDPTDAVPRTDADWVVFTSSTAADLLDGWRAGDARVAAIGPHTAAALRAAGHAVDLVPDTYSSRGLVAALADDVAGARVEVARSDHGTDDLLDGLAAAGADVNETVLYRLVRPPESGRSVDLAADGALDAALFTSSLTVEHFLAAASERSRRAEAVAGLAEAVVATIGEPTRETATGHGLAVDVVPDDAEFDALARAAVDRLGA
jgi:uroporphyrinogen-III synthase